MASAVDGLLLLSLSMLSFAPCVAEDTALLHHESVTVWCRLGQAGAAWDCKTGPLASFLLPFSLAALESRELLTVHQDQLLTYLHPSPNPLMQKLASQKSLRCLLHSLAVQDGLFWICIVQTGLTASKCVLLRSAFCALAVVYFTMRRHTQHW